MRIVLDACVLYPSIMRDCLLGAAALGAFEPLWSAKIIEEWRGAARRNNTEAEANISILLLNDAWKNAKIEGEDEVINLPDPNDRHVLGAAVYAKADALITRNHKDFPKRSLDRYGIERLDPDEALLRFAKAIDLQKLGLEVFDRAETDLSVRSFYKRARLPLFAKYLSHTISPQAL